MAVRWTSQSENLLRRSTPFDLAAGWPHSMADPPVVRRSRNGAGLGELEMPLHGSFSWPFFRHPSQAAAGPGFQVDPPLRRFGSIQRELPATPGLAPQSIRRLVRCAADVLCGGSTPMEGEDRGRTSHGEKLRRHAAVAIRELHIGRRSGHPNLPPASGTVAAVVQQRVGHEECRHGLGVRRAHGHGRRGSIALCIFPNVQGSARSRILAGTSACASAALQLSDEAHMAPEDLGSDF